uniref:HDAC_interact domain-containing protein n=1 Tax=Caenorhabditis japonica TaxID=281687 RepID=A0A8R1E5P5_CAEJA
MELEPISCSNSNESVPEKIVVAVMSDDVVQDAKSDEALAYLRKIKLAFSQDVSIFDRFMNVVINSRAQRIELPRIIEQVVDLLHTSPDLVLGFNTFLPAGVYISLADDNRYVLNLPDSEPRVLTCPEGRAGAAVHNDGGAETRGYDESESEEDDDNDSTDTEESDEEELEDLEPATRKLIDILSTSFTASPLKTLDFRTFLSFYFDHFASYKKKETLLKNEPENSDPQEGPAPPATIQDSGEPVQVGDKKIKNFMEESKRAFMVTMLARVCQGEKQLLSATLEFLPNLKDVIEQCEAPIVEKIQSILHNSDPLEKKDDAEFFPQLDCNKIGKKKKEVLFVLKKIELIMYDQLTSITTPLQLKNILTLMNMVRNNDLSGENFAAELPKVMGVHGSEAEVLIRKMLGLHIEPGQRLENDKAAVRGLCEQNQLQQATVCTLGPSYRLRKDMDMDSEACEERLPVHLKLKEVLNSTWASYPSWSSEEVGTTAIKKSNLEGFHFKTEDERYEMDIIVDSNRTIIEELSKTLRDIESMSDEERRAFKLDEKLNCSSKATFMRVLTKIYTDHVVEVIAATQRNMVFGLKKILEALKEKDVIWSQFQQEANKTWADVLDKTLSANITVSNNQQKQYDQKAFKSKSLMNTAEAVYEEKRKRDIDDERPHLLLEFHSEPRLYRDVNDVTSTFFGNVQGGKHDRDRSKIVLYRVLMDWLCQPQQHVELNTYDGDTFTFNGDEDEDVNLITLLATVDGNELKNERRSNDPFSILSPPGTSVTERFQRDLHRLRKRVFFGDDSVYMIIRYHHMILDRFARLFAQQANYNQEYFESQQKHQRWAEGVEADMHDQKTLDEIMKSRRDAVNDIRNVRSRPAAYYDQTLREMKSLGNNQIDLPAFEEAVRQYFPAEVVLFNSIDKLFNSFAKNIHHATCEDSSENPVKLFLKYRGLMDECGNDEELKRVVAMYATEAEEILRGKNMYKFEFVAERNTPFCNIWVIPREEKESDDEDADDNDDGKGDGKEDGKEEKGDGESSEFGGKDGKDGEDKGQQQPPSNSEGDDEEMKEDTPMSSGGGGEMESESQVNEDPQVEEYVDRVCE